MNSRKFHYLCYSLFLLTACSDKNADSAAKTDGSQLEGKMIELEQKINDYNEQLTKLQEIESLQSKMDLLENEVSSLNNSLYVTSEIVKYTSASKTAMLNGAEIKGDQLLLDITYTNKITDEEAPNGFRLKETGEGTKTLSITKDVPIYILENPHTLTAADWEQIGSHQRLLQLFEKSGEVVFIMEWYLP